MYVRTPAYTCTYIYVCTYARLCIRVCIYVRTPVYTCTYILPASLCNVYGRKSCSNITFIMKISLMIYKPLMLNPPLSFLVLHLPLTVGVPPIQLFKAKSLFSCFGS